jgi:hypothetical protein
MSISTYGGFGNGSGPHLGEPVSRNSIAECINDKSVPAMLIDQQIVCTMYWNEFGEPPLVSELL